MPKFKVGDLVQNLHGDYSEKNFVKSFIPPMTVGRIRNVISAKAHGQLVDVKFYGHPVVNFYSNELKKVRVCQ